MRFLKAAIAAACLVAFVTPAFAGQHYYIPRVHLPKTPGAGNPSPQPQGGGSNSSAGYVAGGIAACAFGNAVEKKRKAKIVKGVKTTTYKEEAAIIGDCALPIPVKDEDGKWTTAGALLFWWLGGKTQGYADPDFAIKLMEQRTRHY